MQIRFVELQRRLPLYLMRFVKILHLLMAILDMNFVETFP